jgi:hypothetical protein
VRPSVTSAQLAESWERALESAKRALRSAADERALSSAEVRDRERRLQDERRWVTLLTGAAGSARQSRRGELGEQRHTLGESLGAGVLGGELAANVTPIDRLAED